MTNQSETKPPTKAERERIINLKRSEPIEGSYLSLLNSFHEDLDRFTRVLDAFAARQEKAMEKGKPIPLEAWPKIQRWMTRLRERAAYRTSLFKSYESGVWVVWDADPAYRETTCVLCISEVEKEWYTNCFRHREERPRVEFATWALRIGQIGGDESSRPDWAPTAQEREAIINSPDAIRMGGRPPIWSELIEKSLKTLEFNLLECESSQRDALKEATPAFKEGWSVIQWETKQLSMLVAFAQSLCAPYQGGEFIVWEPPEGADGECDHTIYASSHDTKTSVEVIEESGVTPFVEVARRILVLADE